MLAVYVNKMFASAKMFPIFPNIFAPPRPTSTSTSWQTTAVQNPPSLHHLPMNSTPPFNMLITPHKKKKTLHPFNQPHNNVQHHQQLHDRIQPIPPHIAPTMTRTHWQQPPVPTATKTIRPFLPTTSTCPTVLILLQPIHHCSPFTNCTTILLHVEKIVNMK